PSVTAGVVHLWRRSLPPRGLPWPPGPPRGPEWGGEPIEPVLDVRGISRRFGQIQAVRDLSLHVAPGETYGLLGPNGAGKSTAISMIAGLLVPDDGEVRVLGAAITTTSTAARSAIGLVPQEVAVYPDLTARENLQFFGRLYGL